MQIRSNLNLSQQTKQEQPSNYSHKFGKATLNANKQQKPKGVYSLSLYLECSGVELQSKE